MNIVILKVTSTVANALACNEPRIENGHHSRANGIMFSISWFRFVGHGKEETAAFSYRLKSFSNAEIVSEI